MIDSEQLKLLQKLAAERDELAARQLARAHESLQNAQQQLAVLARYAGDYHQRLGQEVSGGLASETLRNYQAFMQNVSSAITQQEHEVDRRKHAVRAAEVAWHETQRQLKSFSTLAARGAQRARSEANRRQQRQDDEFAARRSRANLTDA